MAKAVPLTEDERALVGRDARLLRAVLVALETDLANDATRRVILDDLEALRDGAGSTIAALDRLRAERTGG
jgi:hypothetical protein